MVKRACVQNGIGRAAGTFALMERPQAFPGYHRRLGAAHLVDRDRRNLPGRIWRGSVSASVSNMAGPVYAVTPRTGTAH